MTVMKTIEVPCQACGGLPRTAQRRGRWGSGRDPKDPDAKCVACGGTGRRRTRAKARELGG